MTYGENANSASVPLSLLEYNRLIKGVLTYEQSLIGRWVVAETSDLRTSRGHCYLELLQKDEQGVTVARQGAVIWASAYAQLDKKFATATGSRIASNMKVLVKLTANYHELFGLKHVISDIDPSFSLGDMARLRREILQHLAQEGVLEQNKELSLPPAARCVAVVSAQGAAGYGDFCNQLNNNPYGIQFYTCLFPAVMQGAMTAPTIIAALRRISAHEHLFDCVVLIRGGGATSDLNSFDNLELAREVATCPLPVITGIGHDRDRTVLDEVSALPVKTPTAAAELLIANSAQQLARLEALANKTAATVREAIAQSKEQVSRLEGSVPMLAKRLLDNHNTRLTAIARSLPLALTAPMTRGQERLKTISAAITSAAKARLERETITLNALTDKVKLLSPQNALDRGYSITMLNGHAVSDASKIKPGDSLTHRLKTGIITTTVTHTNL